jgi:Kef-type K+ transport system membrane component KefB
LPFVLGGEGIEFVQSDPALRLLAQVGILILLFEVGLEADLRAFARVGPSAVAVAVVGVLVPMALGWMVSAWWLPDAPGVVHLFVGATLAATSVGITVRVLSDLRVMRRLEAQIILGAAILDDILGLIVLAVASGVVAAANAGTAALSVGAVAGILLRAALFMATAIAIGLFLSGRLVALVTRTGHPETMLVLGLGFCFAVAYVAERIGLADIIGAFAAGIMLDPYGRGVRTQENQATLAELLRPLATFFVPLFFVLMGMQVHLASLAGWSVLGFGAVLIASAVVGKLICGIAVLMRGVNRLAVGIGMVPRGEVGLIFAGIGAALTLENRPVLSQSIYSAVVVMVLVTTLLTPPGLRWAFRDTAVGSDADAGP